MEAVLVWERFLREMKSRVGTQNFGMWFEPLTFVSIAGDQIYVTAPNEIFRTWIQEQFSAEVSDVLKGIGIPNKRLHIMIEGQELPLQTEESVDLLDYDGEDAASRLLELDPTEAPLNPKYLFETFVVGSSNQFAHAAAQAVADAPAKTYNPLYIYGGVGLGKTHLMHAIGHFIRERNKTVKLVYLSSEKFMNELINAIRYDKTLTFREKYRSIDVLLIDDIQFIAGKERTQEEFFHTFNALYDAQKQIVISSDCPPKEIPTLEERLHSRFEWGLIADIQPPDLETKVAILRRKAEMDNINLSDEVALFIASKIKSNIRELEGSLVRLVAYSSLKKHPIDLNLAREVLRNILEEDNSHTTIEEIQKVVAAHYGLKVSDLKAKNNSRNIAVPRQIAMYLCKILTKASLPEIGREFGGKHHTTVLHSINKIAAMCESDKNFHKFINKLIDSLR
ncbi:MAG: chromosomal replication initiator protein DnaA [Acidobacteriota bacterium]|nr:chromosomal replication initiator protein DnaA [Blastocatellia bacterium]MDW8412469.1 chromosomal replication initiator protein DnaA [Acidobacteriota bacterium]